MKATKRLITNIWTVDYEDHGDGSVTINSYRHDDSDGYEQENQLPRVKLIETENRVITGIWIDRDWHKRCPSASWADRDHSRAYVVRNPDHVFSYKS